MLIMIKRSFKKITNANKFELNQKCENKLKSNNLINLEKKKGISLLVRKQLSRNN